MKNINFKQLSTHHLLLEKKETSLLFDSLLIVFILLLLMLGWQLYHSIVKMIPVLVLGEFVFLMCGFHLYSRLRLINSELYHRSESRE